MANRRLNIQNLSDAVIADLNSGLTSANSETILAEVAAEVGHMGEENDTAEENGTRRSCTQLPKRPRDIILNSQPVAGVSTKRAPLIQVHVPEAPAVVEN